MIDAKGVLEHDEYRQRYNEERDDFKPPRFPRPKDINTEDVFGPNAWGDEAPDDEVTRKGANGHEYLVDTPETSSSVVLAEPDGAIAKLHQDATASMVKLQENPNNKRAIEKLKNTDNDIERYLRKIYPNKDEWKKHYLIHQTKYETFRIHYKDAQKDPQARRAVQALVKRHHYPVGWTWQDDDEEQDNVVETSASSSQNTNQASGIAGVQGDMTDGKDARGEDTHMTDAQGDKVTDGSQGSPPAARKPPAGSKNMTEDGIRTRDGHLILGFRKAGFGHRFLIKIETDEVTRYELRSGEKCGRSAADAYRASKGALELGKADQQYSKNDAKRWRELLAVASTKLNHMNYGRSRLPDTYVLVQFEGPGEPVWLTRTTYRRIRGRTDADADIREWYAERDLIPAEDQDANAWLINNKVYLGMNLLENVEDDDIEDENLNYRIQRSGIKRLPPPGRKLGTVDEIFQKALNEREKAHEEPKKQENLAIRQEMQEMREMIRALTEAVNKTALINLPAKS